MKPNVEGLFYGISNEEYHADAVYEIPSVSASILKLGVKETARHMRAAHPRLTKQKEKTKKAWDRGSAAHALILNSGAEIMRVDAKDWKTDWAKTARDDARAAGAIPILKTDYQELIDMRAASAEQLSQIEGGNPFAIGKPEVVMRWREEFVLHGKVYSVWCRAKLDWLNTEIENLYDLKTSELPANPKSWMKWQMWSVGAPIQSALYKRGARRMAQLGILKSHDPDFLFALGESAPPFTWSIINVPSEICAPYENVTADQMVTNALVLWHDGLANNLWPGYDPIIHVAESVGRKPHRGEPATSGAAYHMESQDAPNEAFTPIEFKRKGA